MDTDTSLSAARRYVAAGLSVNSLRLDGSKAPMFAGTEYQRRLPLDSELSAWFSRPAGVGIICGQVSGNHEVLDFASEKVALSWAALVDAAAPGLLARIPRVITGSGGKHFHYRIDHEGGPGRDLVEGAIRTLGEDQYAVMPGSPLAVHESGFPYLWDEEGPTIEARPVLTLAERDVLFRCAVATEKASRPPMPTESGINKIASYLHGLLGSAGHSIDYKPVQEAVAKLVVHGNSGSNGTGQIGDWPPFVSMDVVQVPEFPIDALPDWLGRWVEAVSYETQTPPDLAGSLGLAACAAAVAGKYRVKPSPRNARWTEPLNLYVAVIQPVATRKSPVFRDAFAPLEAIERELSREAKPRIARAESDRKVLERRLASKQNDAARKEEAEATKARYEAAALAEQLANLQTVTEPRLRVDDATPEALAIALQEQGERLLVATDEGGALFEMIVGRYDTSGKKKSGTKCELYLKAHQGGETRVVRVGRPTIHLVRPALTIATTIQPEAVRLLAGEHALRGLGVLARFMWSRPDSLVGWRKVRTESAPEKVMSDYDLEIRRLYALPGDLDEDGRWVHRVIEMDDEADDTLAALAQRLEPELAEGRELAWIGDWAGKLEGACARLAGVLFLALGGQHPERIPREVVASARRLADYYLAHAKATFHGMGDANLDPTRAVWAWARQRESFTGAEARAALRNNALLQPAFHGENPIEEPLKELAARGYLRIVEEGGNEGRRGRPTSETYEIRPELLAANKSYFSIKSYQFTRCEPVESKHAENASMPI